MAGQAIVWAHKHFLPWQRGWKSELWKINTNRIVALGRFARVAPWAWNIKNKKIEKTVRQERGVQWLLFVKLEREPLSRQAGTKRTTRRVEKVFGSRSSFLQEDRSIFRWFREDAEKHASAPEMVKVKEFVADPFSGEARTIADQVLFLQTVRGLFTFFLRLILNDVISTNICL